jgi:hypothetical protein
MAGQEGEVNIRAIRQQLLTHVALELDAGTLTLTLPPPTPGGWKLRNTLHKFGVPLVLLLLSPLLLISLPFVLLLLRLHERSDPLRNATGTGTYSHADRAGGSRCQQSLQCVW